MNGPFTRLAARLTARRVFPGVTDPPTTPGPAKASLSPVHPSAGYAEGTEPGWMTRWDMWADTLNAPTKTRDAA